MSYYNQEDYIQTALEQAAFTLQWQASDITDAGNGYPVTDHDEYTDQVMDVIEEDVTAFITDNYQTLVKAGVTAAHAGHDFILTANHHGAGFWDRGLGDAGDKLTEACKGYSFDAEFALWGDQADGEMNLSDEVAYLMVENTVIYRGEGFSIDA